MQTKIASLNQGRENKQWLLLVFLAPLNAVPIPKRVSFDRLWTSVDSHADTYSEPRNYTELLKGISYFRNVNPLEMPFDFMTNVVADDNYF